MSPASLEIYLTPAAISYLTEIILSGIITVYLGLRLRKDRDPGQPTHWLAAFFASTTVLLITLFGDVGFAPSGRLYFVYLENTLVAFCLLFLLIFAYNFPRFDPHKRWEFLFILSIALFYLSAEAWFALIRYLNLATGEVMYRSWSADYMLAGGFAWIPIVFLRQVIFADQRHIPWWMKLRQPGNNEAKAARALAFVYLVTLSLSIVNILRAWSTVPTAFLQLSLSAGLMVAMAAVVYIYLSTLPESTSFMIKLSGATLTILLLFFSGVGWVIAPVFVSDYQPALPEQQTLRFTPNASGGYTVTSLPLRFDQDLGELQKIENFSLDHSWPTPFQFPFFGQMYTEIFIAQSSALSIGEPFANRNCQFHYGTSPAIYLLNTRLATEAGGGIYVRENKDRLTITWLQQPLYFQREKRITIQAVLYSDGVIEMNFGDLPDYQSYILEGDPYDSYWLTGVTPGNPFNPPEQIQLDQFPLVGDSRGMVEDHYMAFRLYVHRFLQPLAWLVLLGSFLCVLGIPLLLYLSVVKPLNTLISGVQGVNAGDLDITIPVASQDEIGFLTNSFNSMIARLRVLIHNLEAQVAERTAELKRLATTDELTGLANRRHLIMVGSQAFEHAKRYRHNIAALMIDIDHFKVINDQWGHRVGDRLLQVLGICLRENVRAADIVGRYGGEEFVLLLPETDLETARKLAERLAEEVRALSIQGPENEIEFTVSIGVSSIDFSIEDNVEAMIDRADQAMYNAKRSGRNRVIANGDALPHVNGGDCQSD